MSEELLHFIWKHQLFTAENLTTDEGVTLLVIHPGTHNNDAGPDFFNAKIKIGNTLWAGNVEIHLKSSHWVLHNHHKNPDYNNVVLHVVLHNDTTTVNCANRKVPVFEMNVPPVLGDKYLQLMQNQKWVSCQDSINKMNKVELMAWLEHCLVSKLEERTQKIQALKDTFNGDWDQVLFVMISRSFGFGTNAQSFEMMARQLPYKVLLRHADNLIQLEALLLGQSGLLEIGESNTYTLQLKKEYAFLKHKYNLVPIDGHLWKFLRLRPVNFPTVRLAQLAALIYTTKGLLTNLTKFDDVELLNRMLAVSASEFWNLHYTLNHTSDEPVRKSLGKQSCNLIVINAIVPFMFAYGVHRDDEKMQSKAFRWLEFLPAERNNIIHGWDVHTKIKASNAFESQALVYLRNHYCVHKKCLQCRVGQLYLAKREPIN